MIAVVLVVGMLATHAENSRRRRRKDDAERCDRQDALREGHVHRRILPAMSSGVAESALPATGTRVGENHGRDDV